MNFDELTYEDDIWWPHLYPQPSTLMLGDLTHV